MLYQGVTWPSDWYIWAQYLPALFLEFDFSFGTFFTIPFKPVRVWIEISCTGATQAVSSCAGLTCDGWWWAISISL